MTDDAATPGAEKDDPFRVIVVPEVTEPSELSDAALDGVAGGTKPGGKSCGADKG